MSAQSVAAILRGPSIARMNFHCGPTRVYPHGYDVIAHDLLTGRLRVMEAPVRGETRTTAYYSYHRSDDWAANTFYLPATLNASRLSHRALIVHEATHALQDYHRVPLRVDDAECAAYLAQTLYFRLEGQSFAAYSREARGHADANADALLMMLEAVALRLDTVRGTYEVPARDYETIRGCIQRHPMYMDHFAHRSEFNGFAPEPTDGVATE